MEERERTESGEAKETDGAVEETTLSQEIVIEENFPETAISEEYNLSGFKDALGGEIKEPVNGRTAEEPEPPLAVDTPVRKRERVKPAGKQQDGARITRVEELFADHTSGRKEES